MKWFRLLSGQRKAPARRPAARPMLEALEDRMLLASAVTEINLPPINLGNNVMVPQRPAFITTGPDQAFWYTNPDQNAVGRVSTREEVTLRGLEPPNARPGTPGTGNAQPLGIAHAADGNLWFAESNAGAIAFVNPQGAFRFFLIPSGFNPTQVSRGPDGNVWFTEQDGNRVGRVNLGSYQITEYPLPVAGAQPTAITGGANGDVWFIESGIDRIGRISTDGSTMNEFVVPTPNAQLGGITAAPDGTIWFTETGANKIGRIDRNGTITEYTVPTALSRPTAIAAAADGLVWFIEQKANVIASIDASGTFGETVTIPTADSEATGLTIGFHSVWFTEQATGKIGFFSTGLDINQSFVQSLYINALGRLGSDDELNYWVKSVLEPKDRPAVVNGIERSPEARDRRVKGWYEQFLGRTAQNNEEQPWVDALLAGFSEERVLAGILSSGEFQVRADREFNQATPEERYVAALYSFLIRRQASDAEIKTQVASLAQFGKVAVVQGMQNSQEYRLIYVRGYYRDLLNRVNPPSPSEENTWARSTFDQFRIRFEFESSLEYYLNG